MSFRKCTSRSAHVERMIGRGTSVTTPREEYSMFLRRRFFAMFTQMPTFWRGVKNSHWHVLSVAMFWSTCSSIHADALSIFSSIIILILSMYMRFFSTDASSPTTSALLTSDSRPLITSSASCVSCMVFSRSTSCSSSHSAIYVDSSDSFLTSGRCVQSMNACHSSRSRRFFSSWRSTFERCVSIGSTSSFSSDSRLLSTSSH
mmetsp:Transcript_24971/g.59573  ORF Transcript_24971/g.59573 Transcript_24971/m.59573 type:complete len:203 (-) Transcript_24971:271-879(-)